MFKPVIATILLAFSATSMAKVDTYLSTKYIDLTASSPEGFVAKLKEIDMPVSGDGYASLETETQNSTSFSTTEAGCKLHRIKSELNMTMTLPRWVNVAEQSQAHQLWWKQVSEYIKDHELKHKKIVIEATQIMQQNVKAMDPQADCKAAKKLYRQIKRDLSSQIRDRDYQLDYNNNIRVKAKDFLKPDTLPPIIK